MGLQDYIQPTTRSEGVLTVLPGTQTKARRYSTREDVPLLDRARAQQIGAAGYWYVPEQTIWDVLLQPVKNPFGTMAAGAAGQAVAQQQAKDIAKAAATGAAELTGADRGVLGIFSKLAGVPYPVSVALTIFLAYALLRGADLVPPLRGVVK